MQEDVAVSALRTRRLHQIDRAHRERAGEAQLPCRELEAPQLRDARTALHPGECEMRTKGPILGWLAECDAGGFDVALKREDRVAIDAHPEHARAPKVRKSSHTADDGLSRHVTRRNGVNRCRQGKDARLRLIAEKAKGQVNS